MALERRRMLADHVYDELLAALVDGRYPADSALSIDAVARELDVSQTPIREALVRLEATGLVTRTALKGYRVAPMLSVEEWADLTEARGVIEPVNTYLACQRSDDGLVDGLEERLDRMRNAPQGSSFVQYRQFWAADEEFHHLIAQHSGNRFLLRAHESLGGQVQRFRLFAGHGMTDARSAIAEHEKILRAFQAGDPEDARDQMARHIARVRERVLSESRALEAQEDTGSGTEGRPEPSLL